MNEFTRELIEKLQGEIAERQAVINFLRNSRPAVKVAAAPKPTRKGYKWSAERRRKFKATLRKQKAAAKATKAA